MNTLIRCEICNEPTKWNGEGYWNGYMTEDRVCPNGHRTLGAVDHSRPDPEWKSDKESDREE